jgi:electron transport complex protein RnfD
MNTQGNLLIVSSSPHLHSENCVATTMRDVVIALLPALFAAIYFFGMDAVTVVLTCVITAVLSEAIAQKIMHREVTISDGSAVVTGLLLAFCLPPTIPLWIAAIGAAVAIVIGKHFFGGLGCNIFNPALIGRAFLVASWPVAMTTWVAPLGLDGVSAATSVDSITTATPLAILKGGLAQGLPSYGQLFMGNIAGCLGETSALALLVGALYLLFRGHIDWRIPFSYLGTVFVFTWLIGADPVFHLLAGGLMLGAFFMSTDWVTSPITKKGRIIFGIGCGLLTVIIRMWGGYPEGVCYSILLMNLATPLIDRYTRGRVFGGVKKHA